MVNKKGMVAKVALGLLLVGGGMVALAMAPGLGMALKLVDPNPRKAMDKVERALRRLVSDGDAEVEGEGQERRYRITLSGEQKLARLQFGDYELPKPGKWNKKWWLLCFDIPETDKYIRRLLQTKLLSLGFYNLQNSVFIYSYPCKELVSLTHKAFGLQKHLRLAVVDSIDNESRLLKFFHLKR